MQVIEAKLVYRAISLFGVLILSLFRRKKSSVRVGLSFSDESVSVLVVEGVNGKVDSKNFVIKEAIHHELTAEFSIDDCKVQIAQFIKEKNLSDAPCYCVLSEKDYQLLLVDPPDVPESELQEAMRWKIRDLISFDVENAAIDIFHQPDKKMLYTVVAKKEHILLLINFVSDLGLSLQSIDIAELSYRNFLDTHSVIDRGIALIVLRRDEGKLLIVKQGNLYFSRRFSINYGAGFLDKLPEDDIILELQRSLDYYERQMGQAAPAEIVFSGAVTEEKITPIIRESFQQKITCINVDSIERECQLVLEDEKTVVISGAVLRQDAA